MNQSALDTLLEAAILAPSGDNTQPWRFAVDRQHCTVSVDVDPARDPSPMNVGQRMARIAVGAAIENMAQTASHNGWKYEIDEAAGDGAIVFKLQSPVGSGSPLPLLAQRTTNRRVYAGGEVSPETVRQLESQTGRSRSARCCWLTDPTTLRQLTELIARADALMFGSKFIRDAFLANVRFDQPANAVVDEGLALGTLEVSAFDRRSLKLMPYVPDPILRAMGGKRLFAAAARKLARSASGICLISASDDTYASRLEVGRLWQRAWLALTAQGLSAQPMMSLCVLQNIHRYGEAAMVERIGRVPLEALLLEAERFCSQLDCKGVDALMRFGFSDPPTTRAGRLPLAHSL